MTVSRRDGWRTTITDAGRYYLEHGHHPDRLVRVGHVGTSDERRGEAGDEHASSGSETANGRRPPPRATAAITAKRRKVAAELVATLQRDGELVHADASREQRDDTRKVVDFAKRNGLVPAGQRIERG